MQQADPVDSILGLTHPKRVFISSLNLWKRRGSAMSQAMKSTWVERLVLLTKDAFFWFERGFEGMDGLGPQHWACRVAAHTIDAAERDARGTIIECRGALQQRAEVSTGDHAHLVRAGRSSGGDGRWRDHGMARDARTHNQVVLSIGRLSIVLVCDGVG